MPGACVNSAREVEPSIKTLSLLSTQLQNLTQDVAFQESKRPVVCGLPVPVIIADYEVRASETQLPWKTLLSSCVVFHSSSTL